MTILSRISILSILTSVLSTAHATPCTVLRIYDGDTIILECEGWTKHQSTRMQCVDAPEMDQEPWGERARNHLADLLGGDFKKVRRWGREYLEPRAQVVLDIEQLDTDRYGRPVVRYFHQGRNINLAMVQNGALAVYPKYCREDQYYKAQDKAKREDRGIWVDHGLQRRPWEWREER